MTTASAAPVAIFLMGPTATGKTDFAVELAKRFPVEIVSVDSALVYRGMDIGTAKPSLELRQQYPHHLIDICDPAEAYSAGRFRADAIAVLRDVITKGKVPLLVGGTMLYFRALERGLATLPTASPEVRAAIDARASAAGWPAMHEWLAQVDPASAKRIHPNDPQRIQRALEVYEMTGRSLSEFLADGQSSTEFQYHKIALVPPDRKILRERISLRFRNMLGQGLVDEVRKLRARGDLNADLPSMRAVGYRQVWEFLDGQVSESEMVERAVIATAQLAKRQMTWLRSEQNLITINPLGGEASGKLIDALQTIVGGPGNQSELPGV